MAQVHLLKNALTLSVLVNSKKHTKHAAIQSILAELALLDYKSIQNSKNDEENLKMKQRLKAKSFIHDAIDYGLE